MKHGLWRTFGVLLGAALLLCSPAASPAQPPQKLPSALLVFPLLQADGIHDTRIEILNLTGLNVEVQCFYIRGDSCFEVGFFFDLTPHQPVSWLASQGSFVPFSSTAIPPFFGEGELKCGIIASRPEVEFHTAIQGRAAVFAQNGQTVSY